MFKIYDGRTCFYQWDLDRKLIIEDTSVKEVHFCNKTDECSLVCEVYDLDGLRAADVPNIILQDAWTINVYAYDGNYTKHSVSYKVKARTKPADYIYTETEVKRFDELEDRVAVLEANGGVSIDLSEYVKKTDYATETTAGVIKINRHSGIRIQTDGSLYLDSLNDNEILNKEGNNAVKGTQIDKVVKSGLAYCKEDWTEEEKAAARDRLGIDEAIAAALPPSAEEVEY